MKRPLALTAALCGAVLALSACAPQPEPGFNTPPGPQQEQPSNWNTPPGGQPAQQPGFNTPPQG